MTFIPTPGTVKVDIIYLCAGQQIHNVIWCKREASWTQAQREALAVAIQTWWTDENTRSWFSSAIALAQVDVINQESQSAPKTTLVVSPAVPGTGGSSMAGDTAQCLCATLRTDLRGRNYRGRMYLSGLRATAQETPISALLSDVAGLVAALTALKTAIEALGAVWVIVSKWLNKVQRASGLTTPITAIAMDIYFDSQRRRLGQRGK